MNVGTELHRSRYVQLAETANESESVKQAKKLQLSAPPSELEMAHADAPVDPLDILEDTMMFFRQKAREASDEKTAKQCARYADRAFKTLALYHPFYYRLSQTMRLAASLRKK